MYLWLVCMAIGSWQKGRLIIINVEDEKDFNITKIARKFLREPISLEI